MFEKIKRLNLKAIMRTFSIAWMVVTIIVMTAANVGIDKNFQVLTWAGNSMILFGITCYGLFTGESWGNDSQKRKKNGTYKRTRDDYTAFRGSIDSIIIYFPMFYDWFIPQRMEQKQIIFLTSTGMNYKKAKNIVKYCTLEDLWELKDHAIELTTPNGKKVEIRKLLSSEITPVEMVLKGQIKFEQSGVAYYLQATAESQQTDIMEEGERIRKARSFNKVVNRLIRISLGFFVSLGLGLLAVNEFMKGNDAQAWTNLITRISNLITSIFSGYISGANDVLLLADAIANKLDVLKIFSNAYNQHLFEIYDEDELAKKEVEEYKKEVEESKKNVVDPEPEETYALAPIDYE